MTQSQYYMVLDTETTGFPEEISFRKYYNYKNSNKYNTSRIVQMAWIIYDKKHNEITRKSYIIKPNKFVIPDNMIHGISHQNAMENGDNFTNVIKDFYKDLKDVTIIVGHNIGFDVHVLLAELYRQNELDTITSFITKNTQCTADMAKPICNIIRRYRSKPYQKLPNLKEAYNIIVKKTINIKQHDALNDCILCAEVYQCISRQIIQ